MPRPTSGSTRPTTLPARSGPGDLGGLPGGGDTRRLPDEGRRVSSPHELGLGHWAALLLTLPIACLAEEVLFRGFLLRKAWALMGFWPANVLTARLFAAIHWPGWLASGGLRAELAMMSLS